MTGEQQRDFLALLDERDKLIQQQAKVGDAAAILHYTQEIYKQEDQLTSFIEKLEEESFQRGLTFEP